MCKGFIVFSSPSWSTPCERHLKDGLCCPCLVRGISHSGDKRRWIVYRTQCTGQQRGTSKDCCYLISLTARMLLNTPLGVVQIIQLSFSCDKQILLFSTPNRIVSVGEAEPSLKCHGWSLQDLVWKWRDFGSISTVKGHS